MADDEPAAKRPKTGEDPLESDDEVVMDAAQQGQGASWVLLVNQD